MIFLKILAESGIIMGRIRQSSQQKPSHWPYLLKIVILLSMDILSSIHPGIPVLDIASGGKVPAKKPSFIRPALSIKQLIPVLTLRTMGSLFSTALKAQVAACCGSSALGRTFPSLNLTNQPSLLMFTSQSICFVPCLSRANLLAIAGTVPS